MFRSSHLSFLVFWSLLVTKLQKYYILNLCLHFARQDGQDRKKKKENHATKATKIPNTKRGKYGMNETFVKNFFLTRLLFRQVHWGV